MTSPKQAIEDFLQGQKDCSQGIPHKDGKGENYTRGYKYQLWCEARGISELGMLI